MSCHVATLLVLACTVQAYLTSIFATELLFCARSVVWYRELWSDHASTKLPGPPPGAMDAAWKIYAYFLAEGSAFEVSLSDRRRKQILQLLASPTEDMFDRVQTYNIMGLKDHQQRFYTTSYFTDVPAAISSERGRFRLSDKAMSSSSLSTANKGRSTCFPFL